MSKCLECHKEFQRRAYCDSFCAPSCRIAFNNRRQKRGAMLYDLIMMARFSKDELSPKLAERVEPLIAKWHQEDITAGRARTWKSVSDINYDTRTFA